MISKSPIDGIVLAQTHSRSRNLLVMSSPKAPQQTGTPGGVDECVDRVVDDGELVQAGDYTGRYGNRMPLNGN